ncbi:MAG: PHP-associated domain-containing protein [Patescibacteria group bacterium]
MKDKQSKKKQKDIYISSTVEDIFDYVEKNFSKADIHIHSDFSDSAASIEEILEYVQDKTTLSAIAITDHDIIDGALKAQKIVKEKQYRFEVIIGEEVSTLEGHVIGLFLKEKIMPGNSAHETIKEIHHQGGIAIAAHPFFISRLNNVSDKPLARGIGAATLIQEKPEIDAIEIVNGTPVFNRSNIKSKYFNRLLLFKPEVGGSDAHICAAIGKGYTLFEGKTAQDLKEAIIKRETQGLKDRWNPMELLKYAYSFLPHFARIAFFTMLLGPQPKQTEIINFPSRIKIRRETPKDSEKQEEPSYQNTH